MSKQRPGSRDVGLLLLDVGHLFRKQLGRRLEAQGFTSAETRAVMHLSVCEGISQAGLADRLNVTPITLARLVDRLEKAGWVERRTDPGDRRANRLYLTDRGTAIVGSLRDECMNLGHDVSAAMTPEERDGLALALRRVREALNTLGEKQREPESAGLAKLNAD